MGPLRTLKSGLLALFLLLPSVASADKKPLTVNGAALHPLTFSRLIVRLEKEDDIGIGKAEYRVRFLEELRKYGYPAVGAESLIFDRDDSGQARFVLGGTVTRLECEVGGLLSPRHTCGIAVLWEVMDAELDRVVYKVVTKQVVSSYQARDPAIPRELALGAFRSLLSRPRFVEALRRRPEPAAAARYPLARFRACRPPSITMPRGADLVLRASVVVEAGGSHGSGVVISPDGLMLTAAHVVRSMPALKVRLQDGTRLDAALVRIDTDADVALVRLPSTGASACLALRQTSVATAEEIYAVGAPLDRSLAFSLTRGIVSGTREVRGAVLVQTDASVNAGNSGGPLVDSGGQTVAIVRSKVVGTGVEGVAFGVPVAVAAARLGIAPGEVTEAALFEAAPPPPAPGAFEDVADNLYGEAEVPVSAGGAARVADTPSATPAASSGGWPMWRRLGWVGVGAGGVAAAMATLAYRYPEEGVTPSELRRTRLIRDAAWVVTGAAAALVITSYVVYDAQETKVTASVGPGSVSLSGRF